MITVLNPFTIDPDSHSIEHGHINDEISMTVQADAETLDINYIVKQFGVTGQLPFGAAPPEYADYTDLPDDYHSAMTFIRENDDLFSQLPSNLRDRFNNNTADFLDFISDSNNRAEAIRLGLIQDKEFGAAAAASNSASAAPAAEQKPAPAAGGTVVT